MIVEMDTMGRHESVGTLEPARVHCARRMSKIISGDGPDLSPGVALRSVRRQAADGFISVSILSMALFGFTVLESTAENVRGSVVQSCRRSRGA